MDMQALVAQQLLADIAGGGRADQRPSSKGVSDDGHREDKTIHRDV